MQEILASLIEKDLIKVIEKGKKRTYEITDRGRGLLKYLEEVLDMLVIQKRGVIAIPNAHRKQQL
jgi:predicted transcriptional regulator